MNTNPQTTPVIYQNYNVDDFPATVIDANEAAFDEKLYQLLVEAKEELRRDEIERKAQKTLPVEKRLQQYPLLNKMLAGGIISPDKEAESTMQSTYEAQSSNFDVASTDALLNDALGLSRSGVEYNGHPEDTIDTRRTETSMAVTAQTAAMQEHQFTPGSKETIADLASQPDRVAPREVEAALSAAQAVIASRARAEGLYLPENYKQSDFALGV